MLSLGILLVILSVGSLVLPMLGVALPFIPYQPGLGIIVAAVGLITVLWAARWRVASTTVVDTTD
jgi:hypothetical protein